MSRLEEERQVFKNALKSVDNWDALATTLGCYPGMLEKRVEELEEVAHNYEVINKGLHERSEMHRKYKKRYKQALETIAQETGTPYADIAIKALAGDNS